MILTGEQHWVCPNCPATAVTAGADNRFHPCPGLAGLLAPMVLEGVRARVRAVLREDYVSGEDVRYDGDGRPVTSVVTERDDGQDCAVFAPTARVTRG
ncbi:hypothetical protein [Streptomyces sp. NRRL S-455]|uniref:hypothetical protein n=1 Tax=Streptomyces sp. NRRL S-455 TaxID=1463908 RepID=UPI0004BFB4B3|nr:hypothetical protein [Streptomyces sp. NRRL S-455]